MKPISTTMKQVIFKIFGDMFFLFPEEYDGEVDLRREWIKYSITISGERNSKLNFYFTPTLAKTMAANFLGMDQEQIDPEIIKETIKEAVNVIGGNILNILEENSKLGIPEEYPAEGHQVLRNKSREKESIILDLDDELLLVTLG